MKRLFFTLLFLFAAYCFLPSATARAARPPLVLAFYYDWYDANTWKPDKVPDMPATPYNSNDPGAIARQIQQARGAGIDAFVVSWWGAGNPTDSNFKIMLDQARAANFQVAVDFDPELAGLLGDADTGGVRGSSAPSQHRADQEDQTTPARLTRETHAQHRMSA